MARPLFAVRPITAAELAVLRRTVEVGSINEAEIPSLDGAESLQVIGRCACGCASIDFQHLRPGQLPSVVADASAETGTGEHLNVLVFATEGRSVGLVIVG